ncbi:MAG: tetratricopeptide repeat protein [Polyangiales bacterium]
MRRALLSLSIVLATAFASPAWAQTRPTRAALAEARRRFERGIALHDRGDDAAAVAELRVAWELSRRPSALYNLGIALQAMRRDEEALEAFRTVLSLDRGVSRQLRRDVRDAVATLEASLAWVRVELSPASAALQIDGRDVTARGEFTLLAGEHRAVARAEGHREATETFTLSPGEHHPLRLTLEPVVTTRVEAPAPATGELTLDGAPPDATWTIDGVERPLTAPATLPRGSHRVAVRAAGFSPWEGDVAVEARVRLRVSLAPRPTPASRGWVWGSFGASGALAIGAAVLGGLAVQTHDTFLTRTRDATDLDDLTARGRALSTAADVFGVAAFAGVVTGLVLLLKGDPPAPSSSAVFALTSAGVSGLGVRF